MTPSSSSLLDHQETPVTQGDITLSPSPLHHTWLGLRLRTFAALRAACVSETRLRSFALCGSSFWVWRNKAEPHRYLLTRNFCHDRLCQTCASRRAWLIRSNLRPHLKSRDYRFITLTLAHNDDPLKDRISFLFNAFRALRNSASWKGAVTGGIAFTEITFNAATHRWHVHLHVVVTGTWYDGQALREDWRIVTRGSRIVDITFVNNPDTVATYISKYSVKGPGDTITHDEARFVEFIDAVRGRRLVLCFGTCKNWRPLKTGSLDGWQHEGAITWLTRPGAKDPDLAVVLRAAADYAGYHVHAVEISMLDPDAAHWADAPEYDEPPDWLPSDVQALDSQPHLPWSRS